MTDARRDGRRRPRAPLGVRPSSRCSSRRPASSACSSTWPRSTRGIAAAADALSPRRAARDAARAHHDDRSVPQGSGRRSRRRRAARFRVGGIAKGSGMIEPLMATMLGVRDDGRAGRAGAAAARAGRGDRRHVQRDHRRRRVLDQRLRVRAGQRRERRAIGEARSARCWSRRCARVCEPLAIGIVRGGEGATKLITVQVTGGAHPTPKRSRRRGRSPTRRWSRPRFTAATRTGAAWSRSPGRAGVGFDPRSRARCASATSSCSATARRTTSARRRRPNTCRARTSTSARRPGHRRQAAPRDVDLRPERRIRADQRGVPHMSVHGARQTGRVADRRSSCPCST